jgi:hypothetical protein
MCTKGKFPHRRAASLWLTDAFHQASGRLDPQ